jgi:hypothetical protein
MTSLTIARSAFVGALSVVAVAAAACTMAPTPVARVAQLGVNPNSSGYSCYFADGSRADRVVGGRTFHWCGPVPRAVQ